MKKLIIAVMMLSAFTAADELMARCVEGNCTNGKGTFIFKNGSRYEGEFKNGSFNGAGTYYFFNGSQYEGTWKEGKMSGKGLWRYANGMKMKAEYSEGKITGDPKPEPLIIYKDFQFVSSVVPENTELLFVMKSVSDLFTQFPITEDSFFGEKVRSVNRMKNDLGFNPLSKKDLEEIGIDMERQVGVVISDIKIKDINNPSVNFIFSIPLKDQEKVMSTLKKTLKRVSHNRIKFEYRGDVLRMFPAGATVPVKETLGLVKRNGFLFFGFNPNGDVTPYLQKILDREKSLADTEVYRDVVEKLDTGQEAFLYFDGRKFMDIYSMLLMQSARGARMSSQQRMMMTMYTGMMKNLMSVMKDYRGIGVTLDYNRGDFLFDSVTIIKEGSDLLKMYTGIDYNRENILGIDKKPVGFMVIGINMKEYVEWILKSLPPFLTMTVKGKMQQIKDTQNIDIQQELINNLAGNINVAVYDGGKMSSKNLPVVITVNVKDEKVMKGLIEKLIARAPKGKVKKIRLGRVKGYELSFKKETAFFGMSGKNLVVALSKPVFRKSMKPRMARTFLYRLDPEIARALKKEGTFFYLDSKEVVKAVKNWSRVEAKLKKRKPMPADKSFEVAMGRFYYAYINSWLNKNDFYMKGVVKTKFNKPFFYGVSDLIQEIKKIEKERRKKEGPVIKRIK